MRENPEEPVADCESSGGDTSTRSDELRAESAPEPPKDEIEAPEVVDQSNDFHPAGRPQPQDETVKRPRSSATASFGTWIALFALLAASVSAYFAYDQAESTRMQLQGQQRAQDHEAAASVRVAIDDDVIELNTLQTFTPNDAHIWLVGESAGVLVEVESTLHNIPSCSRVEFTTSEVLAQATDAEGRQFQENYGESASFVELSVAFQGPSGAWFAVDDQGRMEAVSADSIQSDFDWHAVERYQNAPDTYWEGYSDRAELEIAPIGVGGETRITSDGGFEAHIEQLSCF